MQTELFKAKQGFVTGAIILMAMVRIGLSLCPGASLISNFSPLGAMALFGGACLQGRGRSLALPLLTLFLSDLVLSYTVYAGQRHGLLYGGWYWTYGAFALMTLTGRLVLRPVTVTRMVLATVICVTIHWLVTDLSWEMVAGRGNLFLSRYVASLALAIPFEWRFLMGTLVYGLIFAGAMVWASRWQAQTPAWLNQDARS